MELSYLFCIYKSTLLSRNLARTVYMMSSIMLKHLQWFCFMNCFGRIVTKRFKNCYWMVLDTKNYHPKMMLLIKTATIVLVQIIQKMSQFSKLPIISIMTVIDIILTSMARNGWKQTSAVQLYLLKYQLSKWISPEVTLSHWKSNNESWNLIQWTNLIFLTMNCLELNDFHVILKARG